MDILRPSAARITIDRGNNSVFLKTSAWYFDHFRFAGIVLSLLVGQLGFGLLIAFQSLREKDPQYVVIDEVSGQLLAMLLGCGMPVWWKVRNSFLDGNANWFDPMRSALNWKYLLLGFILFRVFDIWKPFPARQAESLPGGWGIMADDWVAGIYAAIGLWLARAAGL